MPTKIEKDAVTGRDTTGHVWDGVRELNTPLPKWWLYLFAATVLWAAVYFLLYPSIPWFTGYWRGLAGYSQRASVDRAVAELAAQREKYMAMIQKLPFAEIRQDPQLVAVALTAGRIAFAENCQPCHGPGGGGRRGYPALAAGGWIWGGSLEQIQKTITHGVRSGDPDAPTTQMPRFGADGILKPEQIAELADYVMTLYGAPAPARGVAAGQKLFAENCATCHGDHGEGNRELGAPRLASRVHLYGDTRDIVMAQIASPRMGVMPNWNTRLDPATIKSLALYVHQLGGGE